MVVDEQFGNTALSVHQEAISSPFLGEGRLVTRGDQSVQLALATTHQLHKLKEKSREIVNILTHAHTAPRSQSHA